jgi:hypothetical protein
MQMHITAEAVLVTIPLGDFLSVWSIEDVNGIDRLRANRAANLRIMKFLAADYFSWRGKRVFRSHLAIAEGL